MVRLGETTRQSTIGPVLAAGSGFDRCIGAHLPLSSLICRLWSRFGPCDSTYKIFLSWQWVDKGEKVTDAGW
jgi:hypothetical protein